MTKPEMIAADLASRLRKDAVEFEECGARHCQKAAARLREAADAFDRSLSPSQEPEKDEAIKRFVAGEQLGCSTGADDRPTYGYGKLDNYGFWEYPAPKWMVKVNRRIHALTGGSRPPAGAGESERSATRRAA